MAPATCADAFSPPPPPVASVKAQSSEKKTRAVPARTEDLVEARRQLIGSWSGENALGQFGLFDGLTGEHNLLVHLGQIPCHRPLSGELIADLRLAAVFDLNNLSLLIGLLLRLHFHVLIRDRRVDDKDSPGPARASIVVGRAGQPFSDRPMSVLCTSADEATRLLKLSGLLHKYEHVLAFMK